MHDRLLLCAPASGGGKTTVTCALLQALVNRGAAPVAFKCGPDYICLLYTSGLPPMFLSLAPTGFAQGRPIWGSG